MLTVLIATHNGASTLPQVLSAYRQLTSPPDGWQLVIVDNGSTDATKQIIQSFGDHLPLTYVFEPSPGKNAALNTGLAYVKGDLVVLTDDDAVPQADWLVKMREIADQQPSYSIFGGAALPLWETPPEEWILNEVDLLAVFSIADPSWQEGPISPGYVFGNNMAVRAEVFEAGHRFDARIGPRGRNYAMGSETEFALRLSRAGYKSWYCKEAVVGHIIRESQLRRSWILGRGVRLGRGRYRLWIQQENVNRKKYFGIPRYLLKEIVKKSIAVVRSKLRGDPADLFERRWVLNYLVGQAIEARALYKEMRGSGSPAAPRK